MAWRPLDGGYMLGAARWGLHDGGYIVEAKFRCATQKERRHRLTHIGVTHIVFK